MNKLKRLVPLMAFGGLVAVWLGSDVEVSVSTIQAQIASAGPAGPLMVLLLFGIAPLVSLPGMILVAACIVAFGEVHGSLLAMVGTVLFITTPFVLGRRFQPGTMPGWAPLRWVLGHIDRHPIGTVIVLRLVGHLSTPLSATLSLTSIRYRDYLLGSALGMVFPIAATVGALRIL